MFRNHVSNLSSAYCHDELAAKDSRRFAEHLIACTSCRIEFEEVKLGARLAQQLEAVSAPDFLWPRIAVAVQRKPVPASRQRFIIPLAVAASILLLLAGGLFLRRAIRIESLPYWEVARLDGAPRIDSRSIGDRGKLAVGQWLETDANSRAKIDVGNIGNVEIDSNTRVRLVETRITEHRLELARGRLSARISAPPKLFFVNTPSGVAEDLGCAYILEVDDHGNSLLHVTTGWVSLQLTDRASVVPAGAACATRTGIGPGTPYFEDASEPFRTALTKLDFFNGEQNSRASALDAVLGGARPRDAMTLFYLLTRVSESERGRVYDRLTALVPPPEGVTRAGMLNLNQQMMERWKETLSLSWDNSKPLGIWKKMWTKGLGKMNGLQEKK